MHMKKRSIDQFVAAGTRDVWEAKYRVHEDGQTESTIEQTWHRIARALAAVEVSRQSQCRRHVCQRFPFSTFWRSS